ncbi:MAG: tetratricopeptide repeat protein [bacterium]
MQRRIWFWAPVVLVLLAGGTAIARSSGSDSGSEPEQRTTGEGEPEQDEATLMYTRGMELVKTGEYEEARERFEQANKKRKNDPEFLNMLAYTQRKTGEMEKAFENYEKALKIQPEFPQAREYLGEAHLQAVLLQIETLRGYGDKGKQDYDELVAALQRAAETLSAEAFADPGAKTAGW